MPNIITEVELPEGKCRVSVLVNSNVIKPATSVGKPTLVGMGLHRQEDEVLCPECDSEKQSFQECNGEDECENEGGSVTDTGFHER